MFKFLGKLIFVLILVAIIFVGISVFWGGGEKIRWFGKKVEHLSERAGDEADKVKAKSDKLLDKVGIKKDGQKPKETPRVKKDEKSH